MWGFVENWGFCGLVELCGFGGVGEGEGCVVGVECGGDDVEVVGVCFVLVFGGGVFVGFGGEFGFL